MTANPQAIEYIHNNIELVDKNNFEALLDDMRMPLDVPIRDIVDILNEADINPMLYLEFIPTRYLAGSRRSHKLITIPSNVFAIEAGAFTGLDVEKVVIEEGVQEIYLGVFQRNPELKEVYLPHSLGKMNGRQFSGCRSLHKLFYNGTLAEFTHIWKPTAWFSLSEDEQADHCMLICTNRSLTVKEFLSI